MKKSTFSAFFLLFCFLIAARDVAIEFFLDNGIKDPVFMLMIFCLCASIFSWLFKFIRTGKSKFLQEFQELNKNQKYRFLKLGCATTVVYVVTVFGIDILGASIFNFLDYATIPLLTLWMANKIIGDKIHRDNIIASIICLVGLGFFFYDALDRSENTQKWMWMIIAFLSPVFTAYSSALQKQQVDDNLHPDLVLLFRFPIPAAIMTLWFFLRPSSELGNIELIGSIPGLVIIGLLTFFLPLWLLCFGFMKDSLAKFSSYNFLIPIFTILLSLFNDEAVKRFSHPPIYIGMGLIIIGFFVSEGFFKKLKNPILK